MSWWKACGPGEGQKVPSTDLGAVSNLERKRLVGPTNQGAGLGGQRGVQEYSISQHQMRPTPRPTPSS